MSGVARYSMEIRRPGGGPTRTLVPVRLRHPPEPIEASSMHITMIDIDLAKFVFLIGGPTSRFGP